MSSPTGKGMLKATVVWQTTSEGDKAPGDISVALVLKSTGQIPQPIVVGEGRGDRRQGGQVLET